MKNRYLIVAFLLVISTFCSLRGSAQGTATLYVSSMPGFPDLPLDTAYEGQTYAFDMWVRNNTNQFINTTVNFFIRVDSITSSFQSNPATPAIPPNDSVLITVPFFNFTQPQFKMGNNIVVVWPVVNLMVVPVDTFYTDVHFIPLNSLGGIDLNEPSFSLFPVPATNKLQIITNGIYKVEYVRIFDITGQLVREVPEPETDVIDITFLSRGLYFLEMESDGVVSRKKFLKE